MAQQLEFRFKLPGGGLLARPSSSRKCPTQGCVHTIPYSLTGGGPRVTRPSSLVNYDRRGGHRPKGEPEGEENNELQSLERDEMAGWIAVDPVDWKGPAPRSWAPATSSTGGGCDFHNCVGQVAARTGNYLSHGYPSDAGRPPTVTPLGRYPVFESEPTGEVSS